MEIVETHEGDALREMRDEWDDLLSRCERATIYQTWDWNDAWWRAFGARKRLRLLQVRERGTLIGLAPLYISRHLGTPLRRLAFLGTGVTDYMDILALDDRARDVCTALLRYVTSSLRFDMADFQQLQPGANMREAAVRLHHDTPGTTALVEQEPCPTVILPSTWEEYSARLGKKMRSNVSYYDRLLPKTYGSAVTRLAGRAELPAAMDALFELHQKRWNARLLPGVLGGSKVQAFHRLVAQRFQSRGWLRLHLTLVEDRTVAALYCFKFRRSYYYYLGGFAPEMSRYSLGTVLTAHAMRQAIAEGCTTFDFLRGNEPYKYRWLPEARMNCRLLLGRPRSLRSNALLRLNHLERYVEHRAKAFSEGQGRRRR